MADQAETAFMKTFLNTLSSQPITYPDDYQQPPENWLRRVPVFPVEVPAPPERKQPETSASSSASISILFKSLKPPASYTIAVQPTDTISSIKAQLASQPSAPPADAQRLLLKGKALADAKLLKEYSVKDGDTVNLMVKPGFVWDPTKPPPTPPAPSASPSSLSPSMSSEQVVGKRPALSLDPNPKPAQSQSRHQRIPSVVLSPSPSGEFPGVPAERDIMLTLDASALSSNSSSETLSTYHATVSKPEFWERLFSFLRSEFATDADALIAFEDFLRASKGSLTASEIARIRDEVGVIGMAGT